MMYQGDSYFAEDEDMDELTESYLKHGVGLHSFHKWAYGKHITTRMKEYSRYDHWDYLEMLSTDLKGVHKQFMEYHIENENYELCILLESEYERTRDEATSIQSHIELVDDSTDEKMQKRKDDEDLNEFFIDII